MKISRLLLLVALTLLFSGPAPGVARQQEAPAQSASPAPAAPSGAAEAPKPAARTEKTLRFLVVGDTGTGDQPQFDVAKQMLAEHDRAPYDLVIHLGDIVYGKGFAKLKDVFDVPYKPLLDRGVKFRATLGNHDQDNPQQFADYDKLGMGGKTFYDFSPAGDLVEFFTFDSTAVVKGNGAAQLEWLDKELGDSSARWKIVYFHHPPYSSGKRHGDDPRLIAGVVPILKKHGVHIVLNGHEHFFARLRPIEGINYIISGSGGKIHRGGLQYDGRLVVGNDQVLQFLSVTLTDDAFTYSVVGVDGETLFRESIPYQAGN